LEQQPSQPLVGLQVVRLPLLLVTSKLQVVVVAVRTAVVAAVLVVT
jgi:hypothetical protein